MFQFQSERGYVPVVESYTRSNSLTQGESNADSALVTPIGQPGRRRCEQS